jgi:hypothetical protein
MRSLSHVVTLVVLLFGCAGLRASPAEAGPNAVSDWALIVQPAIQNQRPPASSEVLHAMVQLAVYDAVVAIEGGHAPYLGHIAAPPGADVRAAVATAAYLTARARVAAAQQAVLDVAYAAYIAALPAQQSTSDGVQVGQVAAAAMLAFRSGDGFDAAVPYNCSATPPAIGEFEPIAGCGTQPVDVKLANVRPYTFDNPAQVLPDGPDPLTSGNYTDDFMETRDFGAMNSTVRTALQTETAYFWSEHTYVQWNRNLVALATSRQLSVRETARFFAMVHTASADALIAGFNAKYHYRAWRPWTAIRRAAEDGNPDTDPDPTWTPLLLVNHPEYPAAHAFWSTALVDTVAAFFGTHRIEWAIDAIVPQLGPHPVARKYTDLKAVAREIDDARVWAGLHWRHSTRHGAQIGRKVASHVVSVFRAGPGRSGARQP